jgi:hypothetical protein
VSVSKPLKYGPGGASAAARGIATNVASTVNVIVAFGILIKILYVAADMTPAPASVPSAAISWWVGVL